MIKLEDVHIETRAVGGHASQSLSVNWTSPSGVGLPGRSLGPRSGREGTRKRVPNSRSGAAIKSWACTLVWGPTESLRDLFQHFFFPLWAVRPAALDFKITKIDLKFISINMLGT